MEKDSDPKAPPITPDIVRKAVETIDTDHIKKDHSKVDKRRTKKDPIAVTNFLELNTIKLKAITSPENWKELERLFLEDPEGFAYDFYFYFISKALEEISGKKPRGKHKDSQDKVKKMKFIAGWLYAFFYYWAKRPLDDWPDFLKKLMGRADSNGYGIEDRKGKFRGKAVDLTSYCMEQIYTKDVRKYGLNPFDDMDNFYITYILGDGKSTKIKRYISNKTPQEVEHLAFRSPFKNIFKALKLI